MNSITDIVPSPCKRLCALQDNVCEGCGRTIKEIEAWRWMSNQEKQAVWERLVDRQGENLSQDDD